MLRLLGAVGINGKPYVPEVKFKDADMFIYRRS